MMELVTGGSGSGKSAYAEERICCLHSQARRERVPGQGAVPLYYIADMIPYGRETEEKIGNHRKMRAGRGFYTLEWYLDLPGKLKDSRSPSMEGSCTLLECVSNLAANEMYEPEGAGADTVERVAQGVYMLRERCAHLVVVTNDVFRESEPDSEEMARYKEYLGAINCRLAQMADRVTEVVYGIPVRVKGAETAKDAETMKSAEMETGKRGDRHMVIVTGGAYQGKYRYAGQIASEGTEWADGALCPLDRIGSCGAIDHFHLFIRRWMQSGRSPKDLTDQILRENRDLLIVCDEVGCGLVPTDAFEREYREAAGRICTELAKHADEVHRVTCGAGVRIR
ncbi:MAG TPA: bifunctional adenosylcobinamide kinase/adenosylcobinamide-phosphate guanylyltransferase [Candidatus Mediterraneibacter colneyensis]|nr:bifunctional adenosylcobinamide kinase/adenosylcobinamide-phosphate guanylyltransferase [Candidatus Mediterraneibacter colneyensis]